MISQKRCLNELHCFEADCCHQLLLLCMRLCCDDHEGNARLSKLYILVKSISSAAESAGLVSLRLVQSLVLISLYELCNAIHPAAYLTIGRAARLGVIALEMPTRKQGPGLFKKAETWTLWEERRRTWWAIFVLDRLVNIDNLGLPFATAEPAPNELLPVNDQDWDRGEVVPSEPLYTAAFSRATTIGAFAKICQAAHILSKVIGHIKGRRSTGVTKDALTEAGQLHATLSALQLSLEGWEMGGTSSGIDESWCLPLSICISARLMLSHEYGCNEATGPVPHELVALGADTQHISLGAVKALAFSDVPNIAKAGIECPLLAHCFYLASTACAWFIREDHKPETYEALEHLVRALSGINERWAIGGMFSRRKLFLLRRCYIFLTLV